MLQSQTQPNPDTLKNLHVNKKYRLRFVFLWIKLKALVGGDQIGINYESFDKPSSTQTLSKTKVVNPGNAA